MKTTILILALGIAISSCSKSDTPAATDEGPIGGTYSFTGSSITTNDTVPTTGLLNINASTTTTTNQKGLITITAGTISSKGLMYDCTTVGTTKYVNTTTGATTITNNGPFLESKGSTTSSYSNNYTISTSNGELTITDAQYLFNPAFILQPLNNKHSYSLSGNILTVTTSYYNSTNRSRSVSIATFTKQ
jgi:hypothetical protein